MLDVASLQKTYPLNKKEQKASGRSYHEALKDVSFSCDNGSVTALVGVNGAGKTSAMRILTGAIRAGSGQVSFHGEPLLNNNAMRQRIGFHSGSTALYRRLTARQNLAFFGRIYGMEPSIIGPRIDELAETLDFASYLDKKVKDLSTGMSQKVAIARAIIHDPELIILDEPTSGLDVLASATIMRFIRTQKSLGKTILFSTHNMHEVLQLSEKIVVLHNGRVQFQGPVDDFRQGQELTEAFVTVVEGGQ